MIKSVGIALSTFLLLTACSSRDEGSTSSDDDELTSAQPCANLACGEICGASAGYPGAYPKLCNAQKQCVATITGVDCSSAPPAPPPPDPCANLACGETCGITAGYPGAYPKLCNAQKQCVTSIRGVTCP